MTAALITVAAMNIGVGAFKMRRAKNSDARLGWLGHMAMAACWLVTEVQRSMQ